MGWGVRRIADVSSDLAFWMGFTLGVPDFEDIGTGRASGFPGMELTEGVCCPWTLSVKLPVGILELQVGCRCQLLRAARRGALAVRSKHRKPYRDFPIAWLLSAAALSSR